MNPLVILAAAKGVTKMVGGIQKARAVNSAARQTYRNANLDAAFQYTQSQRIRIEQDRSARQAGYDAKLSERASVASAANSAAAGGVQGASIDALIAEELRTGAMNQSRLSDQRTNNSMAHTARGLRIQSQAEGRINQTPTSSFGLMELANLAIEAGTSIASTNANMDQIAQGG